MPQVCTKRVREDIQVLSFYYGKKSFWFDQSSITLAFVEHRSKVNQNVIGSPDANSHISIIQPFIEIIAFDPVQCLEAYLYISSETLLNALKKGRSKINLIGGSSFVYDLMVKYLYDRIIVSSKKVASNTG
jgi:hypothetical protein